MKILVTGGAGFIGSNFLHYETSAYPNDKFVCLDALTYAGNYNNIKSLEEKENFEFVKGDITDREFVDKLFEKENFDLVINFAAESHVDNSIKNPGVFIQTNIAGTQVLMDAARKYGNIRYHQVSTDEVYGDLPLDRPDLKFTEETPIHTSSPYSSSKAGADLLVMAYYRTFGLPVTISRCSNNYGPYQFPEKLIPVVISRALNDETIPVYGKVENNLNGDYILSSQRNIEKEGFDENSDGKFISFDLFFKTSENTRLYLTPESVITYAGSYSVGIENAMRVAFVYEGNTFTGNSSANIQSMITNNPNDVYIWEPNYNKHTQSAIANAKNTYGITINEDSSFVPYDGVKNEISANLNIKASNAKASNYPSLFEKVNIAYYTKTDFTENVEIFSLNKGITKIRVYMWIEGQDVDCENDASVGNISLNLQFSKNPN